VSGVDGTWIVRRPAAVAPTTTAKSMSSRIALLSSDNMSAQPSRGVAIEISSRERPRRLIQIG
jgi:hypothetical protein